jgi:hypothetical protein
MHAAPDQHMTCMEIWGGTRAVSRAVQMDGLDVWVYSRPYESARNGGDIYYASSCATGRINRLLLADVCGHGSDVADTAKGLRNLMRRYVNCLDQTRFVRSMNEQFTADNKPGCFATAVVTTYFAPSNTLAVCNAGHPSPLIYRAATGKWSAVEVMTAVDRDNLSNMPLGIIEVADYGQTEMQLNKGDLLLCYTDALSEARNGAGELIGTGGLLELVDKLDPGRPQTLIDQLLGKIAALDRANLGRDDVTAMLLRPTRRRRAGPIKRVVGVCRFFTSMLKGLNPWGERPALPDWSLPNVGGAIFPPLAQRRVKRPQVQPATRVNAVRREPADDK